VYIKLRLAESNYIHIAVAYVLNNFRRPKLARTDLGFVIRVHQYFCACGITHLCVQRYVSPWLTHIYTHTTYDRLYY